MLLKSGVVLQHKQATFLTLKNMPAKTCVEREDVPYIKLVKDKCLTLEYIYVPERLRGHKLSYALLEVLFEYQQVLNIEVLKFECIAKPYWRKVSNKFPKRILFPASVFHRTNLALVRMPHIKASAIQLRKL